MAGRKSKTATVAKPKRNMKTAAKSGGKSVAKGTVVKARSSAKVGTKRTAVNAKKTKTSVKFSAEVPVKAVDRVVAAAKGVKKNPNKESAKTTSQTSVKGMDVYAELERLAAYIDAAKREIAEIRPDDVKEEYLPDATDELDAVVDATADATNAIMDSCELVEGVMGAVDADVSATLMDATTRIYEACGFQDITGQRISKVVTALKNIEERIDALMYTLGDEAIKAKTKPTKTNVKRKAQKQNKKDITDADLLEGPQLGDKAKSQAEIDDLLASFD
jgi:chemotaxis protein CheZ